MKVERLPVQVFQHVTPPEPGLVEAPLRDHPDKHPFKPNGGLWTSTWETAFITGWPSWTREEDFLVRDTGWLLHPAQARVISIGGLDDALEFEREYGYVPTWWTKEDPLHMILLDWVKVAQDADAVRLTSPYHPGLRFGYQLRSAINWYGWDCESTWWARWCFEGDPEPVDLADAFAVKETC
jgi:hypothetical protein